MEIIFLFTLQSQKKLDFCVYKTPLGSVCYCRLMKKVAFNMKSSITSLIFLFYLTFSGAVSKDQCSTLSCVHSSATIIQRLDASVDPCDDFYQYACGTFLEEQHTPDEKTTVDTIALMSDKLTEYLLTLLTKPLTDEDTKLHKLAKTHFVSCMNTSKFSSYVHRHNLRRLNNFKLPNRTSERTWKRTDSQCD